MKRFLWLLGLTIAFGQFPVNVPNAEFYGDVTVYDTLRVMDASKADTTTLSDDGTNFKITSDNPQVFHVNADATAAFVFEQSDGTDVFIVDTQNSRVSISSASATYFRLLVSNIANPRDNTIEFADGGGVEAKINYNHYNKRFEITDEGGVWQFEQAQKISTGGNNLLTLDGGTAGVRVSDILTVSGATNSEININANSTSDDAVISFQTGGATKGQINYDHNATAANEVMYIRVGGSLNNVMTLAGTGAVDVINDFTAGTIASDGEITFTPTSAPGSPSEGDVYYDSVAKKLKVYNGTSWETITSS